MPIRVGKPGAWILVHPTTTWRKMPTALAEDELQVATDLYFVDVIRPAQR
jgi:hypothetical protein